MSTGGPGPKTGSDADVWANQVSGLAKHMGKDDDPDWDETEQSEHPGCVPCPATPRPFLPLVPLARTNCSQRF